MNNIHTKDGVLLKLINAFLSENLASFTVTSIHSTHTKTETPKQNGRQKKKKKSKKLKTKTGQNTEKSN